MKRREMLSDPNDIVLLSCLIVKMTVFVSTGWGWNDESSRVCLVFASLWGKLRREYCVFSYVFLPTFAKKC